MAGEAWPWGWSSPWQRRQLNPVVIVFCRAGDPGLYLAAISMGLLLFFQEELKGLLVWGADLWPRTAGAASAICCHGCCWRDAGGGAGAPAGSAGAGRCQRSQPGVSLKHLRLAGLEVSPCSSPPAW